ncbi:MAG: anti-sigma factor domain-containing protein [Gaiellaceae bacterium]
MTTTDLHELVAAYALDALDDDDKSAFKRHLASCERCADELASLRETAASLAYAVESPPPPPELRERILATARAERPNVVPLVRRRLFVPALSSVAAVAAVAAVALGVWSFSLNRSLDDERSAREATEEALTLVSDLSAVRTELVGADGSLLIGQEGAAALVVCRLPEAPQGKTYEAWVIADGPPARAGVFSGGKGCRATRLQHPLRSGATVAVTVENAPGVDAPTRDPIFTAKPGPV